MACKRLLIANRGEIAVRILHACADAGIESVAVYSTDDAQARYLKLADHACGLPTSGARAYLDMDSLIKLAQDTEADAIHPGYGFLSENAAFALACETAGITFIGPTSATLELFGNKARTRALARECGLPLLEGTDTPVDLEGAHAFMAARNDAPVMLKAVSGGGGRGMRVVHNRAALPAAFERCTHEALAAFGNGDLYMEHYLPVARHIEIQIIGDGQGGVTHLHERECSLQRHQQKLVEIAPCPTLEPNLRLRLIDAALAMASTTAYRSLGTFEFLVDASGDANPDTAFAFLEANPRLQVEHTVTEMITGIDLVQSQFRIAEGARLADLQLQDGPPAPRGTAIQLRVNSEQMQQDGTALPQGGRLSVFEPPTGPGVRTDTHCYPGYAPPLAFDSLLAKVITHEPSADFQRAVARAARALAEFRITGIGTNRNFLCALLAHPALGTHQVHTRFVETEAPTLIEAARHLDLMDPTSPAIATDTPQASSSVDAHDPLAALAPGKQAPQAGAHPGEDPARSGQIPVIAPMPGTLLTCSVTAGERVHAHQQLVVMEAMKMEHEINAPCAGIVHALAARVGETVQEQTPLLWLEPLSADAAPEPDSKEIDLDSIRPDLEEVLERHEVGLDHRRPQAVARRQQTHQRTARENLAELVDAGSFTEYGPLVIAAQRRRRPLAELIERTPADGMIAGIGTVNGAEFPPERTQCVVMSYDYTVLAGTQGLMNHRKKDRLMAIAERSRLPVVFLTEGGGGRPGDTDGTGVAGLDCLAFWYFARLSGQVPLVGINSGRCFAGNAALLGICDVIIATENSNIGMGGPAMIEGGGLGVYRPEEIGPAAVQRANGVVDIAVQDEAEAVAAAKRYLAYFQGPRAQWDCADQRRLRHLIPAQRQRVYNVRCVIDALADTNSVLELRRDWGKGMVTALARIEGQVVGIMANNPGHLGGALDVEACNKAADFMQLCNTFNLPIVSLCDTPGFMVGPAIEEAGLVRQAGRLFIAAGDLHVPLMTIVLRKGYGLGAQAMAGGSFHAPLFTLGWPTSEFGGMGLEGAVKLGYRKELEAIKDPEARLQTYQDMVDRMYERGKGVNMASHFEIDDVIDPATTRFWITRGLAASGLAHWRDLPARARAPGHPTSP